jgi:PiT family inorganic phosphate transporter
MAANSLAVVVGGATQCAGRSAWSWNFSTDQAHWLSSALVSLARGMNDAPKIWALLLPPLLIGQGGRPVVLIGGTLTAAGAMGLGSWVAGRRVTEVLAERVTRMGHHEGFAANLTTALLLVSASRLGLPVSTTHVSSGSIVGIGLAQGVRAIHWPVLRNMLLAWVVTLPLAGLVAIATYNLLRLFS